MELVEAIFSTSSHEGRWFMNVWNGKTGSRVAEYGGELGPDGRHMLSVGNGYALEAQENAARINLWPLNKFHYESKARIIAPGRLNSFAATPDHSVLIFSIQNKIYFYQAASGYFRVISNIHFQTVNVIKINGDGCIVACGGADGLVSLWNIGAILSRTSADDSNIYPLHLLTSHLLPVTGIGFTYGLRQVRVVSVSEDRTAKVYDVATGILLLSVIFDAAIKCIVLPSTDLTMFVGQQNGSVIEVRFSNVPSMRECHWKDEVLITNVYSGHTELVTCLAVTMDGSHVVSASTDSTVRIWDTFTGHCIHVINEKGPVSFISVVYLPYFVFHNQFKPKYNFQSMTSEKKDEHLIEICSVEYPTPSSLNTCDQTFSQDNDKEIDLLRKANKSLYIYALRKLSGQIGFKDETDLLSLPK